MDPYPHQSPNYQPSPQMSSVTNGKAIASMVLGILSIVIPYIGFILGIIAIVFSRIAAKEIRLRGDQGRGFATTGLVCGIIGTALYAIIIAIFVIAIMFYAASDLATY
ncbi:DUF4190 domain-containing protein [Paenibacillus sp. SYP-B3998]|uniref:DUF4190 domain-containing protein n=1 Tax=Paenibacillus sp. SYP-B3998 TaxID=2678564 RepID=A0A6G4A179_9BACL|nr:DUF4190 domain-containing protein [Paenibacillus sp. SYP-B3998]NEW07579.1 DUF4190 domain-containing protein [Paenibacillus sp. SYP-B3998]